MYISERDSLAQKNLSVVIKNSCTVYVVLVAQFIIYDDRQSPSVILHFCFGM